MKILILLTLTANFFNLIHRSSEECPTKTDCIQPNQNPKLPIEIGIIYDLYSDRRDIGKIKALDTAACQLIKEFGGSLSFKRYPGATVVVSPTGSGIECGETCLRNREDACKGIIDSRYVTQCDVPELSIPAIQTCVDNLKSDKILKENGELRCKLGIPVSEIPTLIFNQDYDGCNDFSSVNQLKTFLCSTFGEALKGKGC